MLPKTSRSIVFLPFSYRVPLFELLDEQRLRLSQPTQVSMKTTRPDFAMMLKRTMKDKSSNRSYQCQCNKETRPHLKTEKLRTEYSEMADTIKDSNSTSSPKRPIRIDPIPKHPMTINLHRAGTSQNPYHIISEPPRGNSSSTKSSRSRSAQA
jgi:hypothetical protein